MTKHPKTTPNALPAEAIPFQPDPVEIANQPLPGRARLTLWVIVVGLATAIAWASLARLDRVVVSPGRLATDEPTIVLHPLEPATILKFDVQVGDKVAEGQALVELDPAFANADTTASESEFVSLEAQIARLEAELSGAETFGTSSRVPPTVFQIEAQLLIDRRNEANARLAAFQSRERRARNEIDQLDKLAPVMTARFQNIGEVVQMREQLIPGGGSSKLQLIIAQNEQLNINQELIQLRIRRQGLQEEIETIAAEREAFSRERRRVATEQLVEARRQQERALGLTSKSQRRSKLVSLVAPKSAIVLERARLSIGSVAQSTQPLLVLVPTGGVLEGEIEIPSKDISLVEVGNEVAIKIEAFPFQQYGLLRGNVKWIAPDAIQKPASEGGAATYRARVSLQSQRLVTAAAPMGLPLTPGMLVTGEILAGDRSVLSYLLHPVLRSLGEAMREPRR
jgi:HlyD family secretion protein